MNAKLVELEHALQATDSVTGIVEAVLGFQSGPDSAAAATVGVTDGEQHIRFEYAGDLPAELRDRYHVAELDSPLVGADVVRTGKLIVVTDTFELPSRYEHAVRDTAASVRACVAQPLRDQSGDVVGVLTLMWPAPRHFDAAELAIFGRMAELTSAALDRVRVTAREQLPDVGRGSTAAAVAAVHRPAADATSADWYSVTPLDRPDALALSVGQVEGRGVGAAAAVSRLRDELIALAHNVAEPAAVLGALDSFAAGLPAARCATVAYAVVEADAEAGGAAVRYSCAGHPYPLVVLPDGRPEFLEAGRLPPLAMEENNRFPQDATATVDLPPGSLIVLYTDGLIERDGEPLERGSARLKAAAAHCADLPVESLCSEVLSQLSPPGGYHDDVVVLAVRPSHAAARSFVTVLTAVAAEVPVARERLRNWLNSIRVSPDRELDILLAAGEAVTNAIEHGSPDEPRATVSMEAFLRQGSVAVSVSDSGRWVGDSSESLRNRRRGRGLTLIGGLANDVDTVRTPAGTRVTLRFDDAVAAATPATT